MNTLTVQHLKKTFGKGETAVSAVDDVSFDVSAGEIALIMGPSGSGKTTLLSMIGGLLTPTSGSIAINGKEITRIPKNSFRTSDYGRLVLFFNPSTCSKTSLDWKMFNMSASLLPSRLLRQRKKQQSSSRSSILKNACTRSLRNFPADSNSASPLPERS